MCVHIVYSVFCVQDETNDVISDLRDEIGKLRDKLASTSEPNREDVLKMEVR